jgi:C4-dicarboxylate-specific signal transduction histidine kinase
MRRRATALMQDTKKTKKQLIQELVALQQRLAACEAFNRQHQQTADALPESEAHFAGDVGSCRDITEQKQMEEALPRFVDHLPIDQRPVLQYAMDRACQAGATQYCEIIVSSPQGTVTWWSYRVAALTRTATDNGFLVVVTDITAHKATERAIRQHDRLATVGTLAAGIAHEINNPLGVIRLVRSVREAPSRVPRLPR